MLEPQYGSFPVNEVEAAQPTAQLRWSKDGKLQSLWLIVTYQGAAPGRQRNEWRDVPTEGEAE